MNDRPRDRQIGAWQSAKITAFSVMRNVVQFSKARLRNPSSQDLQLLKKVELLIDLFEKKVSQFKIDRKNLLESF